MINTESFEHYKRLITKTGQVMNLCFELLPEAQKISCMEEMNNQKISEIYELFVYDEIDFGQIKNRKIQIYLSKVFPSIFVTHDNFFSNNYNFSLLKKEKRYTALLIALISDCIRNTCHISDRFIKKRWDQDEILKFIINIDRLNDNDELSADESAQWNQLKLSKIKLGELYIFIADEAYDSPEWVWLANLMYADTIAIATNALSNNFSFIGKLFIDMGAINSALKLYEIDQCAFNEPNQLSLLASNAIKIGALEWAVKLIN
ncbi:MAG: hypothetical protein Q8Q50_00575, partial [Methylobacter sp.]|nr:hypothetical protein [Methylobacter sp.]